MKWGGSLRTIYFIGVSFLVFSGCQDRQDQQELKGMVCNARQVSRADLVHPTSHQFPSSFKKKCNKVDAVLYRAAPLSALEQHQQFEAQLIDIPIPVMVKPIGADQDADRGVRLVYQSDLLTCQLQIFFMQEMERFGWQLAAQFEGQELLLHFKKPGRFCTVSVRPFKKGWWNSKKVELILFVGNG